MGTVPADMYDAAGNVQDDGTLQYKYDEEGLLCAEGQMSPAGVFIGYQYVYDVEGRRVAKIPISSLGTSQFCDPPPSLSQATASLASVYVLDQAGNQVTETDGAGNWRHTNVFAAGQLLATYDINGLHFNITDALGTKRLQASGLGMPELNCTSLPFGDGPACTPQGGYVEAT